MKIELQPDGRRAKKAYASIWASLTAAFTMLGVIIGLSGNSAGLLPFFLGPAAGLLGLVFTLPLFLLWLKEAKQRKWIATDDALDVREGSKDPEVIPWKKIERIRAEGHRISFRVKGECVIRELCYVDRMSAQEVWKHWAERVPWYTRTLSSE